MIATSVEVPVTVTISSPNQTSEQFTEWLKGFLDAAGGTLTPEQIEMVRARLSKVVPAWLTFPFTPSPVAQPWPQEPFYEITCGWHGADEQKI